MTNGLRVESLSVDRGGRRAIDDVSFEVSPDEVVAVVGPNGAGKSTLLEAILGLLPVASGRVLFGERPLGDVAARSRVFSYMPDEAEPPSEVRVATLVAYAERFGRMTPDASAKLAHGLRLTDLMRKRAGRLSRGQKRRVLLFAALCTTNPVIVLDEPLAAFDPLQLLEVLPLLRGRADAGATLLLSVHQLSDAEKIASRVLVLDAGRVVAFGTLDEVRTRAGDGAGTLEGAIIELLRRKDSHARS